MAFFNFDELADEVFEELEYANDRGIKTVSYKIPYQMSDDEMIDFMNFLNENWEMDFVLVPAFADTRAQIIVG